MAIIKIKFITHLDNLVNYVMEKRDQADPVYTKECDPERIASDFRSVANVHKGKGSIQAIHVIQSWGAEESKSLSKEEFNEIGQKLAEGHFKGHDFAVITHTETGKIHNHIIVCPWHTETGKKIENKKQHL